MIDNLKKRIQEHEGFRDVAYNDTLGIATIGWGHMILPEDNIQIGNKYSVEFLKEVFEKDFNIAVKGAKKVIEEYIPNLYTQDLTQSQIELIEGVLIEMVFQMGRPRVSKFKKTLKAINEGDFTTAADEMLDSRWADQTGGIQHKMEKDKIIKAKEIEAARDVDVAAIGVQLEQVRQTENSWKDEWLTLTFSGIFICHFIGPLQPYMDRGWEILTQANDYYWVIILTIVGGSFGVSTLKKLKK